MSKLRLGLKEEQLPPSADEKKTNKVLISSVVFLLIVVLSVASYFGLRELWFEFLWQSERSSYAGGPPPNKGIERERYRKKFDAGQIDWQ